MGLVTDHTAELLLDMAALLVRDNDRLAEYAARVENMPKMHAKYLGQIEGQRTALSMIAGYLEHRTTDELIERVRLTRPALVGRGRQLVDSGTAGSIPAASIANVLEADARQAVPIEHSGKLPEVDWADPAPVDPEAHWPVDHAEGEA